MTSRRRSGGSKTRKIRRGARKSMPWSGWGRLAPQGRERTKMYRKCGKKCFLGTKTPGDRQHPDFPICAKGTCKVNTKGLYSAYIRARQWGKPRRTYRGKSRPRMSPSHYRNIASRAKRMLRSRGVKVGK
jgi:hypothetical protein